MPFGNGMGPTGLGPMTGRGAGFCAGYSVPGYLNPVGGRGAWGAGQGFGRGRGRGFRHMYWATGLPGWQRAAMGVPAAYPYGTSPAFAQPSEEQELAALRSQLKAMEQGIGQIQERIQELERADTAEKK
jgi:hypothetical protein